MIISASRRTDIPCWYAEWFRNRLDAGFCTVPNPFNSKLISRVSLAREDVDAFVFWTRDPRPFEGVIEVLEARGYPSVFLFTLMANPAFLEPKALALQDRIGAFRALADRIGGNRIAWRYDPIVLSDRTPASFHRETFVSLARALEGCTDRVIVSLMDPYRKTIRNLRRLGPDDLLLLSAREASEAAPSLLESLAAIARKAGMTLTACAEPLSMRGSSILPARCVDAHWLNDLFSLGLTHRKDRGQRRECGCAASRDIGVHGTCPGGCLYCYATGSPEAGARRHREHDPCAEVLGRPHATL